MFIYAVSGDNSIEEVNVSIKYLKKYTKKDILIIYRNSNIKIDHDNFVEFPLEFAKYNLSNREAAILLKTSVCNFTNVKSVYLDSDIVATRDVDSIFSYNPDPILFCNDHSNVDYFSRCSVKNGHLVDHLKKDFNVEVNKDYIQANGGLFLFDKCSIEFLRQWHTNCLKVFSLDSWVTRDQGALIATMFQMRLQNSPRLPSVYNYLISDHSFHDFARSCLLIQSKIHPFFLHFLENSFNNKDSNIWQICTKNI